MENKKKLALRFTVIFIAIMLFFTFFSKTIIYIQTPQVRAELPTQGKIEYHQTFYNGKPVFAQTSPVYLGIKSEPILAELYVAVGDKVKKGDHLYKIHLQDNHKKELALKVKAAKAALEAFLIKFDARRIELENKAAELAIRYDSAWDEREIGAILRSMDQIDSELAYMKKTEAMDGSSKQELEGELELLKEELTVIDRVTENKMVIDAKQDGFITQIFPRVGEKLSGDSPVMAISPVNTTDMAEFEVGEAPLLSKGDSVQIKLQTKNKTEEIEAQVILAGENTVKVQAVKEFAITASFAEDTMELWATMEGEYREWIIPTSALISENVAYVIEEREGFWGKELYAKKVELETGESDGKKTALIRGISRGEKVITGWDRELKDGCRVATALE